MHVCECQQYARYRARSSAHIAACLHCNKSLVWALTSILWIRKLRLREQARLIKAHSTGERQSFRATLPFPLCWFVAGWVGVGGTTSARSLPGSLPPWQMNRMLPICFALHLLSVLRETTVEWIIITTGCPGAVCGSTIVHKGRFFLGNFQHLKAIVMVEVPADRPGDSGWSSPAEGKATLLLS